MVMVYQIQVKGCLELSWSDWFDGIETIDQTSDGENGITTFCSTVLDQAALRGILNRMWDLNLIVLSVICIKH